MAENFEDTNPEFQDEAAKAFKSFCNAYLGDKQPDLVLSEDHPIVQEFSNLFEPSMTDFESAVRRGNTLVFG